jgi:hypothetical protein
MPDDKTPKTLTLTYFCGHRKEIENDCEAEARIEFHRRFNCPDCHAKTDQFRLPTLRPLLFPDYLRLPKSSIAQEIELFTQQTIDPKKLN